MVGENRQGTRRVLQVHRLQSSACGQATGNPEVTSDRERLRYLPASQHSGRLRPEAGFMLVRQQALPAYNIQTAVDTEHALMVTHAVVLNASDIRSLRPIVEAAKRALGVDSFPIVSANKQSTLPARTQKAHRFGAKNLQLRSEPKVTCEGLRSRRSQRKACSRCVTSSYLCHGSSNSGSRLSRESEGSILNLLTKSATVIAM
jgi:hypothetical protein